ncbi:hypothetical protein ACU4HD_12145 [Cupriavidus basilensis]
MSTATDNNAYGTTAEMALLRQWAKSKQAATLLRNYIAAAPKREVWGSIDKTAVLLYAQQLLTEAEAAGLSTARAA